MDRNAAAEELAKILANVGIEGGLDTFYKTLNSPLRRKDRMWETARIWCESQPDEVEKIVQFMLRQAVVVSVVGLAVHFDGAAGYEMIEDRPAELAVSFLLYDTIDDAMEGRIAESIQVCPKESGEEIHDILLDIVDRS
jgi:hypothetical protein